ncbi:PAS domain-containing protein [Methylobacterium sp. A54F]
MASSGRGRIEATSDTALQTALDATDVVGRWRLDVDTGLIHADALVALLFGFDPDAAEAGIHRDLFAAGVHPEDRERSNSFFDQCAREGGWFIIEHRVRSADGVVRWIFARGHFDVDDTGRVCRASGIVIDMSHSRPPEAIYAAGRLSAADEPLDEAARHFLAGREALKAVRDPTLQILADTVLLALGRRLAKRIAEKRRRNLN